MKNNFPPHPIMTLSCHHEEKGCDQQVRGTTIQGHHCEKLAMLPPSAGGQKVPREMQVGSVFREDPFPELEIDEDFIDYVDDLFDEVLGEEAPIEGPIFVTVGQVS